MERSEARIWRREPRCSAKPNSALAVSPDKEFACIAVAGAVVVAVVSAKAVVAVVAAVAVVVVV